MLVPNLLPKVVPHSGSRLLLGLIVRLGGRLVESRPPLQPTQTRPAGVALGERGGLYARYPGAVAPLSQRARLLALRLLPPALLLPEPLLPEPVQPAGTGPGARAAQLQRDFARELCEPSAVYGVMDTTLVPDPRPGHRGGAGVRRGLLAGQATFGRCRSKTEWVYGFKVALVVDPDGVITAFGLAPANSDERPIGGALIASDRHDAYLADKGFFSLAWERHWLEVHGTLVAATPKDNARRAWPETDRRWAAGKRQVIEQVISQLKDHFALERHRAKSLGGLLARLAAKIAAYTCGQRLNSQLGRPLRHLAALLV